MGEKRQTRTYDQELCEHAVRQVFDGERTLTEVAYALGINHWTLRDWVRAERARRVVEGQPMPKKKRRSTRHKATGAGKSASAVAPPVKEEVEETIEEKVARLEKENARLKRENAELSIDRDILKKAEAFLARANK